MSRSMLHVFLLAAGLGSKVSLLSKMAKSVLFVYAMSRSEMW